MIAVAALTLATTGCGEDDQKDSAATTDGGKQTLSVFGAYATAIEEPWDGVIHSALQGEQEAGRITYKFVDALGYSGDMERTLREVAQEDARATMYTTLSPCHVCTGAILLYGIPRVVIGENSTFLGAEDLLRSHGVEIVNLNSEECVRMMEEFIAEHPEIWFEDIGEEG